MMSTCDCCKQTVQTVDEHGLCFGCEMVHHFAAIIEEGAEAPSDKALDIAWDLVEYTKSRILELGVDAGDGGKGLFADVAIGMVRDSKEH